MLVPTAPGFFLIPLPTDKAADIKRTGENKLCFLIIWELEVIIKKNNLVVLIWFFLYKVAMKFHERFCFKKWMLQVLFRPHTFAVWF